MMIFQFKRVWRNLKRPDVRFILSLVVVLFAMVLLFGAVFSVYEEGVTFGDGLWTAYITMTTIGYGDFSAKTGMGRFITVTTTLFGIGCFGIFTGVILEKAMQRRIRKMKGEGAYTGGGHLVIVNVPSYEEIKELVKELDLSPDFRDIPRVVITDKLPNMDKEAPDFLMRRIDGLIVGLPSTLETLERAKLSRAKACLLLSSNANPSLDDTNTLTAGLIEKNWPEVTTIVACSRSETMKNLSLFNIDGGISATDLQMGLLVQELEDPGVFEVYNQLSSNTGGSQVYISRTPVDSWSGKFNGLSIGKLKIAAIQLNIPAEILGIKNKTKGSLVMSPANSQKLEPGDCLVYMAQGRFDWRQSSVDILKQVGS